MRVATNTFSASLVRQLNSLNSRQAQLQLQASTGKRVQSADDDPSTTRKVLDLQAETMRTAQFQKSIDSQKELATASFTAIKGLKKLSDRASEIATLADGAKSPDQIRTYALEVDQLIKQGVQLANAKYDGRSLFAGTKSDQPAFAAVEANGTVTSVTYQGNTAETEVPIGDGTSISAQVLGANTSGTGGHGVITDSRSGADFFAHLISLRDHLKAGDVNSVATTDRPALAKDEDNFIDQIGLNGSIQTRLETASTLTTSHSDALDLSLNKETSSDLAQTLVELNQATNAYQAALQSGGSLLRLSLLDYIR